MHGVEQGAAHALAGVARQICRMKAPIDQHLGHDFHRGAEVFCPHEPIGILTGAKFGTKQAYAVEGGTPHQKSLHDKTGINLAQARIVVLRRLLRPVRRPEIQDFAGTELQVRTLLEPGRLPAEFLVIPNIVGVLECDQRAFCLGHAAIASSGGATVLLADNPDARELAGYGDRVIHGPVIDQDDLDRPIGLRDDALQRLRQIPSGIIGGYDNADQR